MIGDTIKTLVGKLRAAEVKDRAGHFREYRRILTADKIKPADECKIIDHMAALARTIDDIEPDVQLFEAIDKSRAMLGTNTSAALGGKLREVERQVAAKLAERRAALEANRGVVQTTAKKNFNDATIRREFSEYLTTLRSEQSLLQDNLATAKAIEARIVGLQRELTKRFGEGAT